MGLLRVGALFQKLLDGCSLERVGAAPAADAVQAGQFDQGCQVVLDL